MTISLDELAGESLVQLDGTCLDIVHPFIAELVEEELPCVPPIADAAGVTLHHHGGLARSLPSSRFVEANR